MAKLKLKTNRATAKRFNVTSTGKVQHKKKGMRHNLECRSKKAKRKLRQTGYLTGADAANTKALIPYK